LQGNQWHEAWGDFRNRSKAIAAGLENRFNQACGPWGSRFCSSFGFDLSFGLRVGSGFGSGFDFGFGQLVACGRGQRGIYRP
jgi:hypothetical protein